MLFWGGLRPRFDENSCIFMFGGCHDFYSARYITLAVMGWCAAYVRVYVKNMYGKLIFGVWVVNCVLDLESEVKVQWLQNFNWPYLGQFSTKNQNV